jgi:GAF domain-containing protein
MSGSALTSLDGFDLVLRAMCVIANAARPDEIVTTIRQHTLLDADCIILIRESIDLEGRITARAIVDWDRDGLTHAEPLPDTIRRQVGSNPLVIADIDKLDDSLASIKSYAENVLQAASLIILPMSGHQHIMGYLVLGMHKPYRYDEQQVRQLTMLALYIGVVLENRELSSLLDRRSAQAGLAHKMAQALSGVTDITMLKEAVVSTLDRVLASNHMSIALSIPDHPDADMLVFKGPSMPPRMSLAGTRIKQAIARSEALLFEELGGWPDSAAWQSVGVNKLIVAPLLSKDQLLGTLNVGGDSSSAFSPDDIALCEQTALQVAATLQTIHVVRQLELSLEETSMLYSVSLSTSAAQRVEDIYSTVLGKMAELGKADRVTLYLVGPDPRREIEYIEASAIWEDGHLVPQTSPTRYEPDQIPLLAQFPQSRSNLVFNDIQTDPRLGPELRASFGEEDVRALMLIPLSTGAVWLGSILIEGRSGQMFLNDQARICRSLADQAALAINAQLLLARTQQVVGYEQVLIEISNRIHGAETIEEIRQVAASELSNLLGISREQLMVGVYNPNQFPDLSREQRELFDNVGVQVALATENLRLLERVRRSASREQLVSSMTAQLQRAAGIDGVMEATVRTLSAALDNYDVKIRLLPPEEPSSPSSGEEPSPESASQP